MCSLLQREADADRLTVIELDVALVDPVVIRIEEASGRSVILAVHVDRRPELGVIAQIVLDGQAEGELVPFAERELLRVIAAGELGRAAAARVLSDHDIVCGRGIRTPVEAQRRHPERPAAAGKADLHQVGVTAARPVAEAGSLGDLDPHTEFQHRSVVDKRRRQERKFDDPGCRAVLVGLFDLQDFVGRVAGFLHDPEGRRFSAPLICVFGEFVQRIVCKIVFKGEIGLLDLYDRRRVLHQFQHQFAVVVAQNADRIGADGVADMLCQPEDQVGRVDVALIPAERDGRAVHHGFRAGLQETVRTVRAPVGRKTLLRHVQHHYDIRGDPRKIRADLGGGVPVAVAQIFPDRPERRPRIETVRDALARIVYLDPLDRTLDHLHGFGDRTAILRLVHFPVVCLVEHRHFIRAGEHTEERFFGGRRFQVVVDVGVPDAAGRPKPVFRVDPRVKQIEDGTEQPRLDQLLRLRLQGVRPVLAGLCGEQIVDVRRDRGHGIRSPLVLGEPLRQFRGRGEPLNRHVEGGRGVQGFQPSGHGFRPVLIARPTHDVGVRDLSRPLGMVIVPRRGIVHIEVELADLVGQGLAVEKAEILLAFVVRSEFLQMLRDLVGTLHIGQKALGVARRVGVIETAEIGIVESRPPADDRLGIVDIFVEADHRAPNRSGNV